MIAGGESGPGARVLDAEWVRELRDRCLSERVPFFFKQWGGVFKSRTGRILDGRTWDEMPGGADALVRAGRPRPALASQGGRLRTRGSAPPAEIVTMAC